MSTISPAKTEKLHLSAVPLARRVRRVARTGVVNYMPDLSRQVNFIHGTPVDAVPPEHVAWKIEKSLDLFDFGRLDAKPSSLGRRGFEPKHLLGPWLLASLEGVHEASELERRLQTDSAYRLLSGGHEISVWTLRTFRRKNLLFFNECVQRTIDLAVERGHVNLEETAVDSVRLEADAAGSSICTLERSEKMVKQLGAVDTTDLLADKVDRHDARLAKHTVAVAHCKSMEITNYSRTDPLAALMKFPHGGSKPGHRLTTVVAGAAIRFCIAFFLSSKPTDHGLLTPILDSLRARLRRAGVADSVIVKIAADAGFCNEEDLAVAARNDLNIDVALSQQSFSTAGKVNSKGLFGKESFTIKDKEDGKPQEAYCPAGTKMKGPYRDSGSVITWRGVNCHKCPLRAQCTTADTRKLVHNPVTAATRETLREMMKDSTRLALYGKRGPIVESMYSTLEDAMGFRRASSRNPATTQAEIVMKILAYNLTRLWAADASRKKTDRPGGDGPDRGGGGGGSRGSGGGGGAGSSGGGGGGAGAGGRGGSAEVAGNDNTPIFYSLLDTNDWPIALVDAVIDFALALQRRNLR